MIPYLEREITTSFQGLLNVWFWSSYDIRSILSINGFGRGVHRLNIGANVMLDLRMEHRTCETVVLYLDKMESRITFSKLHIPQQR